jgi:hypothetical protein
MSYIVAYRNTSLFYGIGVEIYRKDIDTLDSSKGEIHITEEEEIELISWNTYSFIIDGKLVIKKELIQTMKDLNVGRKFLDNTDYKMTSDYPITGEDLEKLKAERQEKRDIIEQSILILKSLPDNRLYNYYNMLKSR